MVSKTKIIYSKLNAKDIRKAQADLLLFADCVQDKMYHGFNLHATHRSVVNQCGIDYGLALKRRGIRLKQRSHKLIDTVASILWCVPWLYLVIKWFAAVSSKSTFSGWQVAVTLSGIGIGTIGFCIIGIDGKLSNALSDIWEASQPELLNLRVDIVTEANKLEHLANIIAVSNDLEMVAKFTGVDELQVFLKELSDVKDKFVSDIRISPDMADLSKSVHVDLESHSHRIYLTREEVIGIFKEGYIDFSWLDTAVQSAFDDVKHLTEANSGAFNITEAGELERHEADSEDVMVVIDSSEEV